MNKGNNRNNFFISAPYEIEIERTIGVVSRFAAPVSSLRFRDPHYTSGSSGRRTLPSRLRLRTSFLWTTPPAAPGRRMPNPSGPPPPFPSPPFPPTPPPPPHP